MSKCCMQQDYYGMRNRRESDPIQQFIAFQKWLDKKEKSKEKIEKKREGLGGRKGKWVEEWVEEPRTWSTLEIFSVMLLASVPIALGEIMLAEMAMKMLGLK